MKWNPTVKASELEKWYALFPRLTTHLHAVLVKRLLERVGNFLGYPVGIILPSDVEPFAGDPESQRALRLLAKFRKEGFLGSFYQDRHHYADEPHGEVTLAKLKDIQRFGFSGKGADMFDRTATLWPAVGEAVERYAMQFYYPKEGEYVDASWNELQGPKADIFSVAGFDDALRKRGHQDFMLMYDKNSTFRWVKAIALPSKIEIWAPLQWFSFSHVQQHVGKHGADAHNNKQEPLLSIPITTGVAAGQNATDATLRGLLEVIERDAFIIYWLNGLAAKRIDPLSCNDERIKKMNGIAKRYRLEMHALYLQTDMPAHTVCSLIIDRSGIGPAVIIGAKTALQLEEATYGALSDVLAQRGLYRKMMDSDEYNEYRTKKEDHMKIGHIERMHHWFAQERLPEIEHFVGGDLVDVDSLPSYNYSGNKLKDLKKLIQFFHDKEYPVFYKELLNDKLKKLTEGLSVTMVRVPDMQPVYLEESLRSVGGRRLREVPEFLGYPAKDKDVDDFSKVPHPFP